MPRPRKHKLATITTVALTTIFMVATSQVAGAVASPAALAAWGDNSAGELGNNTLAPTDSPVAVDIPASAGSPVVQISAGGRHDLAVLANGQVLAWGDDTFGQLGNGQANVNADAEAPALVPGLSGVVAVAAGGEHSLALLSNGTVEAWGANDDGQLGDGTTTASTVPVPVSGLSGVVSISAGDQFSLAVLSNGTVEAWGDNSFGQLGIGSLSNSDLPVPVVGLSGVTQVSGGGQQALALLGNGTVMAWGDNETDQLGDGQDVSTQSLSSVPVPVVKLTHVTAVVAGSEHSLALTAAGTVFAWGDNGFFQLAQPQGFPGGLSDSDVPLVVPGLSHATAIAAGALYSLAVLSNGDVAGWGDNAYGQLGNTSTATTQDVVEIKGMAPVSQVAAGGAQSVALLSGAATSTAPVVPAVISRPPSTPWRAVPVALPPGVTDSGFSAVSASSASDAWAVGITSFAQAPIAEHWDGTSWTIFDMPGGTGGSTVLTGVDDLGPDNAWVVGRTGGSGSERTLIEHWDGSTWQVVASPDPETGPGAFDELSGISGTNPDDLWAIGTFSDGENFAAFLLVNWDGEQWKATPPPTEGEDFGTAITVVSPDDVWAVGEAGEATTSAHFDGTSWTSVPTPILHAGTSDLDELTGLANAGPDDIWASAYNDDDGANFRTPYLLNWTGSVWALVTVPNAGSEGSQLQGVAAVSASHVWVAGSSYATDGGEVALTERFNGSAWSMVPSLDPGQLADLSDNTLAAIGSTPGASASSPGALISVGTDELPAREGLLPLAEATAVG